MMVFGGGGGDINFVPTMLNDTWVLSSANGLGGTPTWMQLSPVGGPPSGRDMHSSVYDPVSNSLIVFGGDLAEGFCFAEANDVWVLSNANGLGGTPVWAQLSPTGGPPSGRMAHSAVYDPTTNRMIVFAGNPACGASNNEVWVLEHANGLGGTPNWLQLSPSGTPPDPLNAPTAAYHQATNRMIVFGGGTSTGLVNNVWVLSNANGLAGTPTWTQLNPTGALPSARSFHSAAYNPIINQLTVFGGNTATGLVNDTWVLSNADGLGGTPTWSQLSPTGGPPSPRDSHAAVMSAATNRMTMFAGRNCSTSCFPLNDVWVLTDVAATTSTPGAVSLGGYVDSAGNIVDASELLLQSGPAAGGKATFGGDVRFASGDPSPTGNVRYIDHVTGDDIKATSFSLLMIDDSPCGPNTHANIKGKATVNGVADQDLTIDVNDCGTPGSTPAAPDTLTISTGPSQVYANSGPLMGGNIRVTKAQ